jgi:hypothetical protein
MTAMNRREAVRTAGLLLGAAAALGTLPACRPDAQSARPDDARGDTAGPRAISADDEALLVQVADTLLPDTAASPGARQAGCGPVMTLIVTDCFDTSAQQRVTDAIAALRTRAPGFIGMAQAERETLLRTIDAEAVAAGDSHWFHTLRDLSLRSYFSTRDGVTRAMRYVREPGGYTGCVPLQPGQPAWS